MLRRLQAGIAQTPELTCMHIGKRVNLDARAAISVYVAGFYKFVVHNVKELELLLMHNRWVEWKSPAEDFAGSCDNKIYSKVFWAEYLSS